MLKLAFLAIPLAVAQCAGPLNLTADQRQNLFLEIELTKHVVQATASLFCIFEPTTSALIGVLDTSKNTGKNIIKADRATAILCASVLRAA
jgi:hypothetical protein